MRKQVVLSTAIGACGLLCLMGMAAAKPQIEWIPTWEAAVQESLDRHVPIVIAFHKDG